MSTTNVITYESMETYLNLAQKQINSTLDVNSLANPFDTPNRLQTITVTDLQIYCDTLCHYLDEELTQIVDQNLNHLQTIDSIDGPIDSPINDEMSDQLIQRLNKKDSIESMTESKSQSMVSFDSHSSQSPTLLTNSANSLVNTNDSNSNVNTISSTSSDHKIISYVNNNYDISCHRLSEYENNNEIETQLLTANQMKQIGDQFRTQSKQQIISNKNNNNINNNNFLMNSMSKTKHSTLGINSRTLPLFGCNIEEIQGLNCGLALPPFIEKSLIFLSQNAVNSVGIFRKSGVKSRIMSLREQAEQGTDIDLSGVCVYDMADLTKMFFRELKPKQLLTQQIISSLKSKNEFTFCSIPDSQRVILQIVLRFLGLIANNSNVNQMNSHNLAICLTPSLCECDGDQQLFDAQKCLEFCINNCETLFVISINSYCLSNTETDCPLPHKHESTALIECGPNDILNRILYERHLFDPTIIEWSISEEVSQNSDTFVMKVQSSAFLPSKPHIIDRNWRLNSLNNIEVIENGYLFESRWSITAQGEGKTLVAHNIAVDLRGHTYDWYKTTFPAIHDNQLHRLLHSFLVNKNASKVSDI